MKVKIKKCRSVPVRFEERSRHPLSFQRGILLRYFSINLGQFDEDMANGEGRFVRMNGEVVVGRWLNNVFVG
jgi:hypothetical protein